MGTFGHLLLLSSWISVENQDALVPTPPMNFPDHVVTTSLTRTQRHVGRARVEKDKIITRETLQR